MGLKTAHLIDSLVDADFLLAARINDTNNDKVVRFRHHFGHIHVARLLFLLLLLPESPPSPYTLLHSLFVARGRAGWSALGPLVDVHLALDVRNLGLLGGGVDAH